MLRIKRTHNIQTGESKVIEYAPDLFQQMLLCHIRVSALEWLIPLVKALFPPNEVKALGLRSYDEALRHIFAYLCKRQGDATTRYMASMQSHSSHIM